MDELRNLTRWEPITNGKDAGMRVVDDGGWLLVEHVERELAALKLAATEQATQAEAVLEERTRERDALALSQGRLLGVLEKWRECPKYSDFKATPMCADLCKKTDAIIAAATITEKENQ